MNLQVKESGPQRQKIYFRLQYMYVCKVDNLRMERQLENEEKEHYLVLLDESHSKIRGYCYRAIWRCINNNDALRTLLTGSARPVSLEQVIDMGGYGVVTTTEPVVGRHVILKYHPRVRNKLQAEGKVLGICELGPVVPPPVS